MKGKAKRSRGLLPDSGGKPTAVDLFCGNTDFDLRGLKHHITHHCEKYAEVVDL